MNAEIAFSFKDAYVKPLNDVLDTLRKKTSKRKTLKNYIAAFSSQQVTNAATEGMNNFLFYFSNGQRITSRFKLRHFSIHFIKKPQRSPAMSTFFDKVYQKISLLK